MPAQIFHNGPILTLQPGPLPEALLVEEGKIRALGPLGALRAMAPQCQLVDLQGCALLPAFIDSHSHLTAYANTLMLVDVSGARSFEEIAEKLQEHCRRNPSAEGWVTAFGYDHNHLREHRHPDRHLLDRAAGGRPVLMAHASGHMGVASTRGLQMLGIGPSTPDPEGGRIGREEGGAPSGYLEETAFTTMGAQLPAPSPQAMEEALLQAQQKYLSYGITTVQEGMAGQREWQMLRALAQKGRLLVDVVAYADYKNAPALPEENPGYDGRYHNRLKLGGYKIFLDGSPQGRTAWLSAPYENAPDGYCGYPIYQDGQVLSFVAGAVQKGRQLLAHCNGDAAAGQFIAACQAAGGTAAIRPVMVHAQMVQHSQLQQMAPLGMVASFFVSHTYHWGDTHFENLGEKRASQISPAAWALQEGVVFTFHQDTPVLPPDMIDTLWCAVNRRTASGRPIGPGQAIPVQQALRAITQNAAYQYFEEGQKGQLCPGMQADLVILSQNPLQTSPEALRSLQVEATIKDGALAFSRGFTF